MLEGKVKISINNIENSPITLEVGARIAHRHDTDDSFILEVASEKDKYKQEENLQKTIRVNKINTVNLEEIQLDLRNLKKECTGGVTRPRHVTKIEEEALIDCLAVNSDVILIRGENLGFTNKYEFEVNLIPGIQSIYVPPYRITHSQK